MDKSFKLVAKSHCEWINMMLSWRYFTSDGPNRHTLKFPSARSLNLLQPAQKCSLIEVIKETVPWWPSILKFLAVSVGWSCILWSPVNCLTCSVTLGDSGNVWTKTCFKIKTSDITAKLLPYHSVQHFWVRH